MVIPEVLRETVLRQVIETAPFPIGVYTGHELKIVLANRTMIETYGKGPDVIGKNYTDILPELANQKIFEQLRGVLDTGKPFEARNQRVDIEVGGVLQIHYFNYNFTPIFTPEGAVYGVMNTAANVTELNLSRQQTAEAEKKLRLALEASHLEHFEIDLNSGTIIGPMSFFSLFSHKGDLFTVDSLAVNLLERDRVRWYEALAGGGATERISLELQMTEDNKSRWIRLTGTLSPDRDKNDVLLGIVQDITDEKNYTVRLSELVKQKTAELLRSNNELKQFGHVLSHDLKEPVRKISMFSGLLSDAIASGDVVKRSLYIDKIKQCAKRLSGMVDAILEYSSAERTTDSGITDLNSIFEGISLDLELAVKEKQATLNIPQLPHIKASPILMHQLFYNLISNALKFTREGVPPVITIHTGYEGDLFFVAVTDNGIGIEPMYAERIFKAFERLHSKDVYEGTGLGLALCQKIVSEYKGSIQVKSEAGKGAVFTVSFPSQILVPALA